MVIKAETSSDASKLEGQLVNVSSYQVGKVSLSRITGSTASGSLSVPDRKLGGTPVSGGVALYERAGTTGELRSLSFSDLEGITSVPASKIAYYHTNSNRQVDIIVMSDVTGDCYEYGFLKLNKIETGSIFGDIVNRAVAVRNSDNPNPGESDGWLTGYDFRDGQPGGAAKGLDDKAAGVVTLNELKGVHRSDFYTHDGKTYLNFGGKVYQVSEEVQCYNQRAKDWFDTLNEARAFSDDLTAYYDTLGNRVRIVVAN